MTNNIQSIFAQKQKVNIGYIVAGYPSVAFTKEFLLNLNHSAIDILEIGIPYSDPLADGKLISQASFTASQAGVTTDTVFNLLAEVKGEVQKPLVFLVYYNLVLAYGVAAFIDKCAAVGISGLIIPDLPYEEANEVVSLLREKQLAFIPLVSVTSGERIKKIARLGDGFIYAVGSLGVTGSQQVALPRLASFVEDIRQQTHLPIALGFGIKTQADVAQMRQYADAVIVGTSIVALTAQHSVKETIEAINTLFKN